MENYQLIEKISEGSSGVVSKAQHLLTSRIVAIKKIRLRRLEDGLPKVAIREITALQQFEHQNIVQLLDVFGHGSSVVLVFECMMTDLHEVMRNMLHPFTEPQIRYILREILRGLQYIHKLNFMHRDMKPANILIGGNGEVKLGDFGLCRSTLEQPISNEVATRWYRAPELLLGSRSYSSGVDIWAVGCIFGELLNHSPLFPGDNDIDQFLKIISVLGTPTAETCPRISQLPDYHKITFPVYPVTPLHQNVAGSQSALDLLSAMLNYDWDKRPSADTLLKHDFFYEGSASRDIPRAVFSKVKHRDYRAVLRD